MVESLGHAGERTHWAEGRAVMNESVNWAMVVASHEKHDEVLDMALRRAAIRGLPWLGYFAYRFGLVDSGPPSMPIDASEGGR